MTVKTNKSGLSAALSAAFALCALSAQAVAIDQTVLSETFESDALGVLTTTGGWSTVDPNALKTKRKIEVVADGSNRMGGGTANQILYFYNIAGDPITYETTFSANSLSTGQVLMVSFDFYEPSTIAGGVSISVGSAPARKTPLMPSP